MFQFDKIKEPVFLKESSSAVSRLEALKELHQKASGELRQKIEQEIGIVEAGIYGENQILFELKNSHIPMVVLHDLFLEVDGYTAQIDFLIVTRNRVFVLECKNLIGNIEIDSSGGFTRTLNYGKRYWKEGIYSPITQNKRHLEVIKKIRMKAKGNWLTKMLFEKGFEDTYCSVVVLANPKTYLNTKYAKKEVRDQVIRGDQLIAFINKSNAEKNSANMTEKDMMELAQYFYQECKENPTDYLAKYKEKFYQDEIPQPEDKGVAYSENVQEKDASVVERKQEFSPVENPTSDIKEEFPSITTENQVLCPKCGAPMVKRVASKGPNAGKEFWGCSNFPKCWGTVNIAD